MSPIVSKVIKYVPYAGPVVQGVGLAFDAKEIIESSTPLGATKIIVSRFIKDSRFIKECTPPEMFFTGKCFMLISGVITSISTGENPLVISGTMSAGRSIIKDL